MTKHFPYYINVKTSVILENECKYLISEFESTQEINVLFLTSLHQPFGLFFKDLIKRKSEDYAINKWKKWKNKKQYLPSLLLSSLLSCILYVKMISYNIEHEDYVAMFKKDVKKVKILETNLFSQMKNMSCIMSYPGFHSIGVQLPQELVNQFFAQSLK